MGSDIQKLMGGIHKHTDRMEIEESYFYFLKIRKLG
jgi:hypothetical protein